MAKRTSQRNGSKDSRVGNKKIEYQFTDAFMKKCFDAEVQKIEYKAKLEYKNACVIENSKMQREVQNKAHEIANLGFISYFKILLAIPVAALGSSALTEVFASAIKPLLYTSWVFFLLCITLIIVEINISLHLCDKVSKALSKSEVRASDADELNRDSARVIMKCLIALSSICMVFGLIFMMLSLMLK